MADPRSQVHDEIDYQKNRYEQQQGPMANIFGYNYGRGSESDFGNYNDIMNLYRGVATGGGGAGGGGGGYDVETWGPSRISYTDPFKSYGGFEEFSKTGGYSGDDMRNMRARGISPVRAAYANAEREVGRQRSLQGGYSPNAVAAQVKMAREQGQATADAAQNVEAGLAEARNRGRQFGLHGMSGIETSRLGADLDVAKFNANAEMQAAAANASARNSSSAAGYGDRMRALEGMSRLYGTTPGMSSTFGNQLLNAVGQGGQMGQGYIDSRTRAGALPGAYEQTMNRVNTGVNTAGNVAGAIGTAKYAWDAYNQNKNQQQQRQPAIGGSYNPGYGQIPNVRG